MYIDLMGAVEIFITVAVCMYGVFAIWSLYND